MPNQPAPRGLLITNRQRCLTATTSPPCSTDSQRSNRPSLATGQAPGHRAEPTEAARNFISDNAGRPEHGTRPQNWATQKDSAVPIAEEARTARAGTAT